jgi:hypothetical protein
MAMRRRSSKTPRTQKHPVKLHGDRQESGYGYGVRVPARLREAIESERDNLSKAESLLACMVVSM